MIVERGWGGVSTRNVAEQAGVNAGVVHYHFESIDELRRQAVADALNQLFDGILAASSDDTPRQLIRTSATAVRDIGGHEMQLMLEAMPATSRDPQMQQLLGELLGRYRAGLADRIRACHPQPLADPEILAELIMATFDGLLLHLLAEPALDVLAHIEPLLTLLGPEA